MKIDVPADQDGVRLDAFLTSALPDRSRSQVQKLIKDGHVTGPTKAVRASAPVKAGQTFEVDLPAPVEAKAIAEDLPLPILYEDADLVVIDKPAGMVVHPSAGHSHGTVVNALLHHVDDLSGIGGELRPGIVHRLDRGTSGVMIAAKNDGAHQELARQFHDREVEKSKSLWCRSRAAGRRIDAAIGPIPAIGRRCRPAPGARAAPSRA